MSTKRSAQELSHGFHPTVERFTAAALLLLSNDRAVRWVNICVRSCACQLLDSLILSSVAAFSVFSLMSDDCVGRPITQRALRICMQVFSSVCSTNLSFLTLLMLKSSGMVN